MASVPSPRAQSIDNELSCLYERRAVVDHLIETLERYAELTGSSIARRPAAKVLLLAQRKAE